MMANDNNEKWREAANHIYKTVRGEHVVLQEMEEIVTFLKYFIQQGMHYTHFPAGGGAEISKITKSRNPGMLELQETGCVYSLAPNELVFEHFPDSSLNSFLLLKASPQDSRKGYRKRNEFMEFQAAGNPVRAHFLGGRLLTVAKKSVWNRTRAHDAGHKNMTIQQIRDYIEDRIQ